MNEEDRTEMFSEKETAPAMTPEAAALYPKVLEIIEDIRGSLQADGGDIELLTITPDMKAKVRLVGACSGCPHAVLTLRYGVERYLCENIPELKGLESADPIPEMDAWGEMASWEGEALPEPGAQGEGD